MKENQDSLEVIDLKDPLLTNKNNNIYQEIEKNSQSEYETLEVIRANENNQEEILKDFNKSVAKQEKRRLPNFKKPLFDDDKKVIQTEKKMCNNITDQFEQIPKDKWIYRDIFEEIKDNKIEFEGIIQKDKYSSKQIDRIKDLKFKNGQTYSILVIVEDEIFLICYLEKREIDNQNKNILDIAYVYKFDKTMSDFTLILEFFVELTAILEFKLRTNFYINKYGIYFFKRDFQDNIDQINENVLKCLFYDFKNENYLKNKKFDPYFDAQEISNLNIEIPNQIPQEEFDYGLILKSQEDYSDDISDQYLILNNYQFSKNKYLYIYSLKDTKKPVMKIQTDQLSKISHSFFFEQEKYVVFILKQQHKNTHYEIKCEKNSQCIEKYQIDDDESIEIEENYGQYDYGRHTDLTIEIKENQVLGHDDDKFSQYYYVSASGNIELIYPLQKDKEKRYKIQSQIFKELGLNESGGQVT